MSAIPTSPTTKRQASDTSLDNGLFSYLIKPTNILEQTFFILITTTPASQCCGGVVDDAATSVSSG